MAKNILNQLLEKRINSKAKAKAKTLTAATPTVDDPTLQTWIKEVSSTVKDIASSSVRRSDLVRANIATIANGELQNALSPPEEVNLTVPAAVLNLTASGAYSSNTLTWETRPSKFFGQNNIYRSDVDDFGTATHIGSTLGDVYTDYVGNNIKAYYWVRTISKFGVEGELSPSVYAETAIDVGYVLQQLEGQITLSQLDQILRGEISSISDIANGLQEEARLRVLELAALADQLRQESIDKAQEIQDRIDGVNNQIQQQIIGLNDGITTEVNSRIDAEQQIINALEAYKLSNDNSVAAVINKVDIATSTNEVQALAISGLQANFETVSEELSVKADISNLTLAENKIAEVDGKVVAATENITALGTRMGTVEGAVSSKLEASALNNYYTKTESDDKATTIAAGEVSKYDANLVIGGSNLLKNSNFERELGSSNWSANDLGSNFVKQQDAVHGTVLKCVTGSLTHDWVDIEVGATLVYSALVRTPVDRSMHLMVPLHCWAGKDNVQQGKYEVLKKSHDVIPAGVWTKIWVVIKLTGDANSFKPFIYDTTPLDGFEIAWTKLEKGNKATDWTPNNSEVQQSINANASAIQSTNADVSRIDGVVTSQASSISSLQSSLSEVDTKANTAINNAATAQQTANTAVTKADATAVIAQNLQASLDNTNATIANNYYTKADTLSAITSASSQLSASFDTAINSVGVIKDTRHDNQPPSWYWTNYPHRTEKEFKYSGALGIPQATVDTLGVLETTVPWIDQTGGAIQQRFTWNDSAYALTRCSISDSAWSVWASALNEVKNTVDRKLDASIISNYYTKAEADNVIAGKVEQFSSSVLTSNENLFKGNILYVYKEYAAGISSFNYSDYWVIDAAAGNCNWISLGLGVSPQTMNDNGLYGGAVTVSMDYLMESGDPEALPDMYFGYGYQTFVHSQKGPHALYTWYRIYTTFYTNPNHLLYSPHLGVGGIVGRICIRNLKIERGNMTAYSVDVRETTQSINGIEAVKTVTIDNNGVMSGYGLISELKNGQVTSSFGVNADTFYIGSPNNNKKPFIHRNDWSVINGVWVPPGTYIDTALIANATISNAQVGDLSADKITAGNIAADRMRANILAATEGQFTSISAITGTIGVLRTATSGARTEIRDNLIEVYDSAGRVRVRMGVW